MAKKNASDKKNNTKKLPVLPMAITPFGSNLKLTPQLPKATKKVNIVDQKAKQSNAEIAKQQTDYANARAQGDYAGMRVANTMANKARASQGAAAYSSAKGDTQFKGNLPRALPKANTARINNYINTGISAPDTSNTPAYIKSYNKGNYLKGTGQLALSTLGAGADLLRNVSANAVSLTSGKGLQPYRADYTKQQYEQNINKFTGNTPLYEQLSKLSPKLSNAYLTSGEILEDPLNLFDVGAKLTATGLKNAGSAMYAQDLLKGGKKFTPLTRKTTTPQLLPNGKTKNVTTKIPVNNTSGFLGQIGGKFEVSKPIITASGKKIASTEDFNKLPTAEKIEVLQSAEKAQPSLPIRASNQAVQPQNVNAVANLPQAEKATPNLPYNPNKTQVNLPKASETIKPQLKPLGADLNQFPRQMKVSKVKTNTLRNSKIFSDAEKNIDDAAFEYDVISEKQSLNEAKQRLQADFNGEVKDLSTKKDFDGVDLDTSMGIAEKYLKDAEQTGNYKDFINWTKNIQEKGTQGGQLIQAFAKYTRTPEGAVIKGQQVIGESERAIAKKNPKLIDKINGETQQVMDVLKTSEKQASDNLSDTIEKALNSQLTPAERLSRRVENTTKPLKPQKDNAINDMISELFRVAKESPLPEQATAIKRNPVEFLTQAIQNKSSYADTWQQAKAILKEKYKGNEEISAMLDDYFNKGIIPTYSQNTLNRSIKDTAKQLSVDFSKIIKQSQGDKDTALQGITDSLIRQTGASGEEASLLAKNILSQYNKIIAEKTELTLKQMFRELPKKGQKTTYQKVMELINMGAYDKQSIRDIIKAKNNLPVLDNDDVKNILENMKLSEKATDPYMKKMYEAKASQIIADKELASITQKFAGGQRLNMIANPVTLLARNPGGNALFAPVEMVKDIPASAVDKLVSLKTGQRTTTLNPQLGAQFKGVKQGLTEWAKDIKYGVDTSPSRGQAELPNGRTFNNKFFNAVDNITSRALQLGDRPFYQAAYNARTAELKKLGYSVEDIDELSRAYALDKVFQNDSTLSKTVGNIRRTVDDATGGIMGHLVLPFSQTPSNLLDKLIDYSPAGYARAVFELGKTSKGTFNQKVFADKLGRALTGTGIQLLAYGMAAAGIITGNEYDPMNKDLNAAKTKAGIPSYSIKVGDKYYSYEWIPVVGPLLAATADSYKAGQDGKDFIQSLGIGGKSAFNTVINQSMLQSIYKLFSGYDPASGMANTLLGSTSQFTQSGVANIAKTIDPYVRETYDPNMFKQQGNKLIARLPFASKTLPKKLDISGQPIMQSQGRSTGQRALENFILPQKVTEIKKNAVNDELLRLNKSTGENEMLLNVAPKQFSKSGQTYTLSPKDYTNYQKTMGQYANGEMEKLIKTDAYKKLSDKDKSKALRTINEKAVEKARMEYFENNGKSPLLALDGSVQEKYASIKNTGITEKQYYNVSNKLTGLSKQEEVQSVLDSTKLTQKQKEALWYTANKSWSETSNPYKDKNSDYNFNLMSDSKKQKFLSVANKGVTKQQFANALGRADTDGNGSIKKSELKQAMINAGFTSEQRRAMYIAYKWKEE